MVKGHPAMRRERLGRWIFFLSAAFLLFVGAFSYGYFVAKTRRFPHQIISQASFDVGAVLDLVRANAQEIHSSRKQGGVTVHDATLTQPGLTFLIAYNGQLFQPFLVDMEGKVVHRWNAAYSILFKGEKELDLVRDSRRHLHGSHLYADGSILASFEHRGMAKLDRCSRPIWLLENDTHHAIVPLPDGSFWTLSPTGRTSRGRTWSKVTARKPSFTSRPMARYSKRSTSSMRS